MTIQQNDSPPKDINSSHKAANLVGVSLTLFLSFILPSLLTFSGVNFVINFSQLLTWSIIAWSGWRIGQFAGSGQRHFAELTFWLFVYVWLGVAPFLQIGLNTFPWPGSYTTETFSFTNALILLGLLSFDFGRTRKITASISIGIFDRRISFPKSLLLAAVSVIAIMAILLKIGDYTSLFTARMDLAASMSTDSGKMSYLIYSTLLRVPVFASFLYIAYIWSQRENRTTGFATAVVLLFLFIVNVAVSNPISSPRYWVGTVVLSTLFIFMNWRGKASSTLMACCLLTVFLVVFPYLDIFRYSLTGSVADLDPTKIAEIIVSKGDYDAYQQLANTVVYVSQEGLTYGGQLLGSLLFFIPRAIWDDKPLGTGSVVASSSGYDFTNLSAPLWAEFYVNFGIPGVLVGFFAFGMFINIIQTRYKHDPNTQTPGQNMAIGNVIFPLFAAYQVFLLRGDLMSAFSYFISILIFFIIPTSKKRVAKPSENVIPAST